MRPLGPHAVRLITPPSGPAAASHRHLTGEGLGRPTRACHPLPSPFPSLPLLFPPLSPTPISTIMPTLFSSLAYVFPPPPLPFLCLPPTPPASTVLTTSSCILHLCLMLLLLLLLMLLMLLLLLLLLLLLPMLCALAGTMCTSGWAAGSGQRGIQGCLEAAGQACAAVPDQPQHFQ